MKGKIKFSKYAKLQIKERKITQKEVVKTIRFAEKRYLERKIEE